MKIRFKLFGEFREITKLDELIVDVPQGGGLRSALRALVRSHPGLRGRILDETGGLGRNAVAFLNRCNTRTLGTLDPPLKEGDTVVLTRLVGGG